VRANFLKIEDPEGGAQDAHRFSTRQDAASKNPRNIADGRFASALESFLWWADSTGRCNTLKAA
jgi:hypothetical protein